MAWDLWSSTYDEALHNSNNSEHVGRQYDIYFDCQQDIMEEDALNEKSCIQALKIMITKEDAEIEELEKDLLSLQNELVCIEHQNWPEICRNALTEKINWLDVSIRSLKNDHAYNDRIQLPVRNEPAETLDEILKAALADYHQDNRGQERLAKSVARSADLGTVRNVIGPYDGMNLLGTSDLKVLVNDEVRRGQLVTAGKGQILNSVSPKREENVLKEVKQESESVQNVTTNERLDSNLCALQQLEGENSDLDQTHCNFAPKTAQRDCEKESKVASAQDRERINPLQVDSAKKLCLAAPESWNPRSSLHAMKPQSASLVNAKRSGLSSILEMQPKSALFTGSQLTDKGKSQVRCLKSEPIVNLRKSIISEPGIGKLNNQGKRKLESDVFSAREPGENPVELISNSSLKVTHKRPRKSRTSNDGANSVDSVSVTKRTIQLEQHRTEYAIVPCDSKFSELERKRNACNLPVTAGIQNSLVTMVLSESNAVAMDNGNHEGLPIQNSWSCSSASVPANLKNLTLSNLKAIAKQHNVKKYYKMAKGPLLEQLTRVLGGR